MTFKVLPQATDGGGSAPLITAGSANDVVLKTSFF